MISKNYRLTERELRKVLQRKKPFFSYSFIANTVQHTLGHSRFAILLSAKVTKGSVNRNFWRRKFYDISNEFVQQVSCDIVFVPKKGAILDYKNINHIQEFEKNICFLHRKIIESHRK